MSDDAIILQAWDAVSSDAALAGLLASLAAAFDCPSAALLFKDRATPAADIAVAHGPVADPAVQRRYALEFAHIDPAPAALALLPIGEVGDTDALFPEAEHHRYRAFLDGFYHPLGLAGALGAPLRKGEASIGMVAVHRAHARAPFCARDAERMRRLVPHLVRMLDLRQVFFATGDKAARLSDALEPIVAAVMILDGGGRLVEGNAAARLLFARRDGLVLNRAGQVSTRDAGAGRALAEAWAARAGTPIVRVPRDAGRPPYILRVRRRAVPPGWVVTASDPEQETGSRTGHLAAALGLSPRAAELVEALVAGETLKTFCARKTMSPNTAKYHLRAAFSATGTNRQSDLVRRAAGMARDLGL